MVIFIYFLINNRSNIIEEKRKEKYKLFMMMNTGKHKQTTKGNNRLVEIRMDLAQGMIIDKITF